MSEDADVALYAMTCTLIVVLFLLLICFDRMVRLQQEVAKLRRRSR
jgi:hypothetical protein